MLIRLARREGSRLETSDINRTSPSHITRQRRREER